MPTIQISESAISSPPNTSFYASFVVLPQHSLKPRPSYPERNEYPNSILSLALRLSKTSLLPVSTTPPTPTPTPPKHISNQDRHTKLINRQTPSLGCAPTPNQYFARDRSRAISLNGRAWRACSLVRSVGRWGMGL